MKTNKRLFKDVIYGFKAMSVSKTGAWMLIRSECRLQGLQVPTFDQIVEVK